MGETPRAREQNNESKTTCSIILAITTRHHYTRQQACLTLYPDNSLNFPMTTSRGVPDHGRLNSLSIQYYRSRAMTDAFTRADSAVGGYNRNSTQEASVFKHIGFTDHNTIINHNDILG